MTVRDALREGAAALSASETPGLDASLLLAAALGTDRSRLLAMGNDYVGEAPLEGYRSHLASRSQGLPLAYIVGHKEFWGRRFAVDPRVLVPRPDTETLVEAALAIGDAMVRERGEHGGQIRKEFTTESTEEEKIVERRGGGLHISNPNPNPNSPFPSSSSVPSVVGSPCLRGESSNGSSPLRVHDSCCGSGCVAISVAADRPGWQVSGSDLSEGALEVARGNAASLIAPGRPGGAVVFSCSDLLSSVGGPFDLVLANPPYVGSAQTDALLALGWSEPRMALDGGSDGLDLVRRLVDEAARIVAPGGALLVEADGDQAEAIAGLFLSSGFVDIETRRDLGGKARVTVGRKPWRT